MPNDSLSHAASPAGGDIQRPRIIKSRSGEQGGDLGNIGERRVRLVHGAAEVLESRPLVLPIALLGVQLDQSAGVGERDEGDLERGLLRGGEVPRCERTLGPGAGGSGALRSARLRHGF